MTIDNIIAEFRKSANDSERSVFPQIISKLQDAKSNEYINRNISHHPKEYLNNIFNLFYDELIKDYLLLKSWGDILYGVKSLIYIEFNLYHMIKNSTRGRVKVEDIFGIPEAIKKQKPIKNLSKEMQEEHTKGHRSFTKKELLSLTNPENNMNILCLHMVDNVQYIFIENDFEVLKRVTDYAKIWADSISQFSRRQRITVYDENKLPIVHPEWQGVPLNNSQLEATQVFDRYNLSIITGGAGTGKTTLLIYILWRYLNINFARDDAKVYLLAPTNMAAENMRDRISNLISRGILPTYSDKIEIATIHKFIYSVRRGSFPEKSLIVIDESSMLDNILVVLFELNSGNIGQNKLIMVGDRNQLRPVQRDSLFTELIERYPEYSTILDVNYRSGDVIIDNSRKILNYDRFYFTESPNFIVSAYETRDEVDMLDWVDTENPPDMQMKGIMFITYRNDDVIYVNTKIRNILFALNNVNIEAMREAGRTQRRILTKQGAGFAEWEWCIGDRCACKTNLSGIYNGSIGVVSGFKGNSIVVKYKEREYQVPPKDLWPAYCVTVHGSQGQEWDTVIFCDFSCSTLLRSLLYVGVTRAKNKLYIKKVIRDDPKLGMKEFEVTNDEEGSSEWFGEILSRG